MFEDFTTYPVAQQARPQLLADFTENGLELIGPDSETAVVETDQARVSIGRSAGVRPFRLNITVAVADDVTAETALAPFVNALGMVN